MSAIAAERAKTHGDFIHEAADTIQLAKVGLWNDAGGQTKWSDYKAVAKVT
ncbi:hypothetical protein PF005_g15227 [Phytophthora fragariae]|uniref:Uncharacterized protein n=1 Tax=Phytophthora fragariae TaxID=53985 RepID=A0A6A3SVQ2_9STRA|nr:hypothetical protein PF003_g17675 [Phytophthora fragariae]KAE8942382.1 hypothetical protein PF009_g7861 [Phytophthora fragariae]KAE8996460.1 hypothetical protein PF011_g15886 [Phytophthora fragariae]KAE9099298.1 hypothetical protein PF010_g15250 [Phytophthora fragariae]KAE9124384.1 hypothetical protein PF007_g6737 [Phytophthora fragariae]